MTVDLPAARHPGAMFGGVHRQIARSPDFVTAIPVTDKHEPLEKKGGERESMVAVQADRPILNANDQITRQQNHHH
ncbi:MAG: hypothetical protein ACKO3T_06740 [Planctomycetaceae bacterium]